MANASTAVEASISNEAKKIESMCRPVTLSRADTAGTRTFIGFMSGLPG